MRRATAEEKLCSRGWNRRNRQTSLPVNENSDTSREALKAALERWKQAVVAELKGASFEKKLVTRTFEGVALQPLYTRADLESIRDLRSSPGEAPFLRGTNARGYQQQPWEIAQEISARTPLEFNGAVLHDLMHGQNSVVLTPDAAARAGLDAEDCFNDAAQIASTGVAMTTLSDLAVALGKIDLRAVPVHVSAGADALPLAAMYCECARSNGASWTDLNGSLAADPLAEWVTSGRLATPLDALYDSLAGWTAWAHEHAPHLRTIGVDAALWGNAGGTAVQELAFALGAAADYVRALIERDVTPEIAGEHFQFRFAIGPQFFHEIAKFRAWRPLWTRLLVAFGTPSETASRAAVHAATGRWNKSRLDPYVNLLRVTTEALSAVIGGCNSLHIAPFDEVEGSPDEFSRRIARNIHPLLAEEFAFTQVTDPAGGSWFVEKLTDEFARKAWSLFQEIESRGGFAAALRSGWPQELVTKAVAEKNEAVGKRRLALVGTNLFPKLKETPLAHRAHDQVADVDRKTRHDFAIPPPSATTAWRVRFQAAIAAAKRGATISQLARISRTSAASECAITTVAPWRAAASFETLRAAATAVTERTGKKLRVFLAKMGPVAQHKARADFAAGFFAVGGFEVIAKQNFESPSAAAEAAAASGAGVVVLCSTDETYPTLVPSFAAGVKALAPEAAVVLAGLPSDPALVTTFRLAGIDEFIHVRANVSEMLTHFLLPTEAHV